MLYVMLFQLHVKLIVFLLVFIYQPTMYDAFEHQINLF